MGGTPNLSLIVLYVADIDRSAAFYAALGVTFQREQHGKGPVHYSANINDTVLELYPASERLPATKVRLGFAIASIDEALESWHRSGFKASIEAETAAKNGASGANQIQRIVVIDPDRNKVELHLS